jgi:GT2 family glycosyltransferase
MKISIIIPYYKPLRYLKMCIQGLHTNTYYPIHEVVVVNDGAPDGVEAKSFCSEMGNNLSFKITFIDRHENRGFVYSCNEGAEVAGGDYLIFLNFDTIPQGGWLLALVKFLQKNKYVGILGSRLLYPNVNLIQHIGGAFDRNGSPVHLYSGAPAYLPFLNKNRRLQWITGAALMISKPDFTAIDGFDKDFVTSSENIDLCFKVRSQLGKEVWMVADSMLYHYTDVTGASSQNVERTHQLLKERWKEEIVRDEESIYWSDGFLPELMELFQHCGIYRNFGVTYAVLTLLDLQELEKQEKYVLSRGLVGLKQDLESLTHVHPHLDLLKSLDPTAMMQPQGDTIHSKDKFHVQRLIRLLSQDTLPTKEKEIIFSQLTSKLESSHYFTILYNVASLMIDQKKIKEAFQLFSFLAGFCGSFNRSLSAKAYYKLGLMSAMGSGKKDYLQQCLALLPEHRSARQLLDEMNCEDT